MFQKISQISQKNTCSSLFLIKLQALESRTLLKRDSDTGVSCEICKNFKNTLFYGTPPVTVCSYQWLLLNRWLNFPLTDLPLNSIYLVCIYLVLIKCKENSNRPKYITRFYSVLKETTRKHLKRAAPKSFFSSVYFIDVTCFDECFLFHVITGRHYFM